VRLGTQHRSNNVNVYKKFVLSNGRPSLLQPCENKLVATTKVPIEHPFNYTGDNFLFTPDDNKQGMSTEDRVFLEEMDKEFKKNMEGNWEAPLPFKSQRPGLPNNRALALNRAKRFDADLRRDPVKHRHFLELIQKLFDHKHGDRRVHFPTLVKL
jgi:hypothetical protein